MTRSAGINGAPAVSTRRNGKLTIRTMLLHYLHGADNARLLAIRLVEEGEIPLLHGAQIVPSYIVSYSWWVD